MTRSDLRGRAAVVTGAQGRLGGVWMAALLEAGASVAALDLAGSPESPRFRALKKKHRSRIARFDADVCDRSSLEGARRGVERQLGPASILVNNAGIDQPPTQRAVPYALTEIPLDFNRRIFDVNVMGLFQAAQVFGKGMLARRKGSIINIGSLYAEVSPDARFYDHIASDPPFLKPPAYGASKAAVVGLTKYLATHWGASGVRVNALSPGGVLGGQDPKFLKKYQDRVPMKRMAGEADLGGPLLFLASDASSYVNGINLVVDGGYTAW